MWSLLMGNETTTDVQTDHHVTVQLKIQYNLPTTLKFMIHADLGPQNNQHLHSARFVICAFQKFSLVYIYTWLRYNSQNMTVQCRNVFRDEYPKSHDPEIWKTWMCHIFHNLYLMFLYSLIIVMQRCVHMCLHVQAHMPECKSEANVFQVGLILWLWL